MRPLSQCNVKRGSCQRRTTRCFSLSLHAFYFLFISTYVGGESAIVCAPLLQSGGGAIPWVSSESRLVCVGDADKKAGFEVS